MNPSRDFYLNLPVDDVERAQSFFTSIGFAVESGFCNEDCVCLALNERSYAMLLRRSFFETFTPRPVGDPTQAAQGLFAFGVARRDEVDRVFELALAHGGTEARAPTDHGFMYGRSFFDPDGHQWEVLWMDRSGASR